MKANEFEKRVNAVVAKLKKTTDSRAAEDVSIWWKGQKLKNVFQYAATSESCMVANMATGKVVVYQGKEYPVKRRTTFMQDFCIAEWCGGVKAVLDTFKQASTEWKDNPIYMAELILVLNFKVWEMHARHYTTWGLLYNDLFYSLRDIVYDYYEGDEEKVSYVWHYLD